MHAELTLRRGPGRGRQFAIRMGQRFVLGRGREAGAEEIAATSKQGSDFALPFTHEEEGATWVRLEVSGYDLAHWSLPRQARRTKM